MTGSPRAMRRLGQMIAVLALGLLLGSCGRTAQEIQGSSFARWWRCHDSSRPLLAETSAPWVVTYSWTDGYGWGDIHLEVESAGGAELLVALHGGEETIVTADAGPADVAAIAAAIDRVGLLCLESRPREDHRVVDLGTFTIGVESEGYAKEVSVATCTTVVDPEAFHTVIDQIRRLAPLVGEELEWGPRGIATLPGACSGGAS